MNNFKLSLICGPSHRKFYLNNSQVQAKDPLEIGYRIEEAVKATKLSHVDKPRQLKKNTSLVAQVL